MGRTYIATTDSGVFHVDQHIVGVLEFRDGSVFKLHLVDSLQDKGKVLLLPISQCLFFWFLSGVGAAVYPYLEIAKGKLTPT